MANIEFSDKDFLLLFAAIHVFKHQAPAFRDDLKVLGEKLLDIAPEQSSAELNREQTDTLSAAMDCDFQAVVAQVLQMLPVILSIDIKSITDLPGVESFIPNSSERYH